MLAADMHLHAASIEGRGMSDRSAPESSSPPSESSDVRGNHPRHEGVQHLAEVVERLMHLFMKTRQQMLDKARQDVDWSTMLLLGALVSHGPMRVKELAGLVQSDPSTVSRHVAQLVRDGFLERHADADDGRASLLITTDKARQAVDRRKDQRDLHYEQMLHAWDGEDRKQLATLLDRFLDDFLTYKNTLAGPGWTQATSASRKDTHI
jgi:DNA-binding MarR family transcriptional regulator